MLVHTLHCKPIFSITRQVHLLHACRHLLAALPHDVLRFAGQHLVATTLRLTHHRKRRVLVNLEGRQRVCNEEDVHEF